MEFIRFSASVFLLLVLFSSSAAFAKTVKINMAVLGDSKKVYRGALIWSAPRFFVGPGLVFYEKLYINGPNLEYRAFNRKNKYKLNWKLSTFNDRKPFITTGGGDEGIRNSRESTVDFEMDAAYKFGFRNLFGLGLKFSYEFKAYEGFYFEPYVKIPVAPFVSFKYQVGIGGNAPNKYLYGDGAKSGVGYGAISLNAFVPLSVGRLICSFIYESVYQRENREASLVAGKPDNLSFRAVYVVNLY